jgi:hypothetical protein
VWHASAAYLKQGIFAVPIDKVSEPNKRVLIKTVKSLISDVGQLPSSVEQAEIAIHYRRALTNDEYSELPPSWCAIPPVHEAGRGVILEEGT